MSEVERRKKEPATGDATNLCKCNFHKQQLFMESSEFFFSLYVFFFLVFFLLLFNQSMVGCHCTAKEMTKGYQTQLKDIEYNG